MILKSVFLLWPLIESNKLKLFLRTLGWSTVYKLGLLQITVFITDTSADYSLNSLIDWGHILVSLVLVNQQSENPNTLSLQ